jgi:uncharacterized protein (TIGR00288 family)
MELILKTKEKIALFIDADNAPAAKIETILSELARYGVVNIRKAYGNWTSPNIKPWADILHEYAIQPMQQFGLTKGKNATDIALVIDAMDVLYTKDVDIICLVSSDCDFTPLVTRALADGKVVIGLGERKAPADDDGWANLGTIGQHISNHASFDARNYGFKKLSDLFAAIDLFEMKQTNGSVTWIKDKRRSKSA